MKSHDVHPNGGRHYVGRAEHSQGDTVTWTCADSEFVIWFPPKHDPLEPGPNESKNRSLTRKLKKNLKKGEEYEYSMFCESDGRLVESNTPPTMIIR